MDYVYRQYISLKKKGGKKKIKDVLTITSKWIQEVEVFSCMCVLQPTCFMGNADSRQKGFTFCWLHTSIFFIYYKLWGILIIGQGLCWVQFGILKGHSCKSCWRNEIRDAHLVLYPSESNNNNRIWEATEPYSHIYPYLGVCVCVVEDLKLSLCNYLSKYRLGESWLKSSSWTALGENEKWQAT